MSLCLSGKSNTTPVLDYNILIPLIESVISSAKNLLRTFQKYPGLLISCEASIINVI